MFTKEFRSCVAKTHRLVDVDQFTEVSNRWQHAPLGKEDRDCSDQDERIQVRMAQDFGAPVAVGR